MKKFFYIASVFGLILVATALFRFFFFSITPANASKMSVSTNYELPSLLGQESGKAFSLPAPDTEGGITLGKALSLRRSIRRYEAEPLSITELSQLLWSGQGVTNERGFRTAPSAGATFPLDLYVVINNVNGLAKGLYQYLHNSHELRMLNKTIDVESLSRACLGQRMITDAGAVIIFGAIFERTTARYGDRGERYVHNEVGHASQNIHLMAASLNLGTVVIGAYRDNEVEELLTLGEEVKVLYLMPIGKIKSK
jgi:SagB-type dehydrogenase family enzyme